MKIFNTLTREKQELIPLQEGQVKIYACGPTVYNFIHIGNARPLCVFDVLRRYLQFRGMQVTYVQNFTDVDDKLIKKANEEGITVPQVAERYIEEYRTDAHGLNVMDADVHPRATENMEEIFDLITSLVEQGYAYESGGDVYFRTNKFKEYGKLSHQPLEELEAGASERVDAGDLKENPMDFALWKAAKEGEIFWESPWGKGRPGWHIECSAMSRRYLGQTIDIHCGGQDLIFPHHENEIAQSECANGCEFARYWMHNGYINVDNRKMSKSLGNFFTVRDVAAQYGYEPIRYLMIASHYRSPINYNVEVIEQNQRALERLYTCREGVEFTLQNATGNLTAQEQETVAGFDKRKEQFIAAMDDDLNTADGISALFELARDINIAMTKSPSKELCEIALSRFNELANVLGLLYEKKVDSLDSEVEDLIAARTAARKNKDFAEADRIRDQLKAMGIVLEDTAQGVKWHKE
ncbi:MAG: cysteine--tRNA ligase [Clostridia bacterium]|nr:cysteine--tRNA ligase [Clostridia bacterium]